MGRTPSTFSALALITTLGLARAAGGQVAPPPQRFTTGGRDIVNMTFAGTQVGELPTGLKLLSGSVDVVDVGGVHMLRASTQAELEMPLPQILPQDFSVEIEFIPKQCCNPHDLGIEGTSVGHSNPGSSQVTWHRNRLTVIGGGESFATDMPDALANSTPGMPTVITIVMQGTTLKLYTNGQRLYTLSDRKFVRAGKLWIYLGGQDDGKYAVYVSRIRVIDNVAPVGPVAATNAPVPATTGAAPATTAAPGMPTPIASPGMPTPIASPGMPTPIATPGMPATTATTAPTTTAVTTMAPTTGTGMVSTAPATTTGVTTAPTTGTGMLSNAPPASGRYRVTMTGVQVTKPTVDDPIDRDGKADEIYASAIVVMWDRQASQRGGTTIVKSREYGDIGTSNAWPMRIRAGTALPTGGLTVGNAVPIGFSPSSALGTPNVETFPLTLWEGTLVDGKDAVVLFASLWERDLDDVFYKDYSANWLNNTAPVLQNQLLTNLYSSNVLMATLGPTNVNTFAQAAAGPMFTQPNYGVYAFPAMFLNAPRDRPIGMLTVGGALAYPERILVVTREKLAALQIGGYTDVQILIVEGALGTDGIYTMYLRVERLN